MTWHHDGDEVVDDDDDDDDDVNDDDDDNNNDLLIDGHSVLIAASDVCNDNDDDDDSDDNDDNSDNDNDEDNHLFCRQESRSALRFDSRMHDGSSRLKNTAFYDVWWQEVMLVWAAG